MNDPRSPTDNRSSPIENSIPRLVLFPGLGLDERLYLPQQSLPARIEVPRWLPIRDAEPLADYARRMAEQIDPAGPLYLGGMSFGAMLALEAAKVLKPRGVFVIAGCASSKQISAAVRGLAWVGRRVSVETVRALFAPSPLMVRVVGRSDRRERKLLLELIHDADFGLMRWAATAATQWEFRGRLPMPVHSIHGRLDHIIPADNVTADAWVPTGGHALNVTHAEEVNAFIAARLKADHRS